VEHLHEIFLYDPTSPLIFSSGLFFLVFTIFFAGYQFLHRRHDARILYLTLFSIFFYYKSSGWYVGLLFVSMFMDFGLGAWIAATHGRTARKILVILSVIVNLGMLAYFKYTNFFFETFAWVNGGPFKPFDIFLPAGISFFTFQSLSYTIDIYRGTLKPVKSFLDYAFFVTFFPQLVAGPIVREKT
jgi:D-alanyl-lipoteichoic acid acyltransferase DltB (MBOAT superfamily)